MIGIVSAELILNLHTKKEPTTLGVVIGFVIMMILDISLS